MSQNIPGGVSKSMMIILALMGIANVIFAVLLFKWRKIGFWGFLLTSIVALAINLNIGMSIGQSLLGLVGIIPKRLDGANLTENAAKIINFNNLVLPRFLMYYLDTQAAQKLIKALSSKNAQPKLALSRIKSIQMPAPDKNTQQEIVNMLDIIMEKIQNHTQKKQKLEELFKSMLHQLMSGEIRVNKLEF